MRNVRWKKSHAFTEEMRYFVFTMRQERITISLPLPPGFKILILLKINEQGDPNKDTGVGAHGQT